MKKQKVQLTELILQYSKFDYLQLYQYILSEIEKGKLKPIKASKLNGKKPALYNAYWRLEEENDYSDIIEEMTYQISPLLDMSSYKTKPEKYLSDREKIQSLSNYLIKKKECLNTLETINERSFEIFHREKFLDREGGSELLKRLGFSAEKLNFYQTTEPMSYYSHKKQTPQNFLIIENKDTFYSMRKHLILGNKDILGLEIGTLIYGGGKGIYKSFEDYINSVEPYFHDAKNTVFYFGDLDYEGILIYENLVERYQALVEIKLFTTAYIKMLEKMRKMQLNLYDLPKTKEGQNQKIGTYFLKQFSEEIQENIRMILEEKRYIPQEILNGNDY